MHVWLYKYNHYFLILNANWGAKMGKIWEEAEYWHFMLTLSTHTHLVKPITHAYRTASFPAFNPQSRAGLDASIQCFLNVTGIVSSSVLFTIISKYNWYICTAKVFMVFPDLSQKFYLQKILPTKMLTCTEILPVKNFTHKNFTYQNFTCKSLIPMWRLCDCPHIWQLVNKANK